MTREEKLWTMTGTTLLQVAEGLGIKTTKSTLKQGKEKLINKILEAENIVDKSEVIEEQTNIEESEIIETNVNAEITETKLTPKRGQLITYNGKSQNLRHWAKEIGISTSSLYHRLYKANWPLEKALVK